LEVERGFRWFYKRSGEASLGCRGFSMVAPSSSAASAVHHPWALRAEKFVMPMLVFVDAFYGRGSRLG
jgi:hypothetical protein